MLQNNWLQSQLLIDKIWKHLESLKSTKEANVAPSLYHMHQQLLTHLSCSPYFMHSSCPSWMRKPFPWNQIFGSNSVLLISTDQENWTCEIFGHHVRLLIQRKSWEKKSIHLYCSSNKVAPLLVSLQHPLAQPWKIYHCRL